MPWNHLQNSISPTRPRDLSTSCADAERHQRCMQNPKFLLLFLFFSSLPPIPIITSRLASPIPVLRRKNASEGRSHASLCPFPESKTAPRRLELRRKPIRVRNSKPKEKEFSDQICHLESFEGDVRIKKVLQEADQRILRSLRQKKKDLFYCSIESRMTVGGRGATPDRRLPRTS